MTFTREELKNEIRAAEQTLEGRALRLWERIRTSPARWLQDQYSGEGAFWVIGILGNRCLYFNEVEKGWGWGRYDPWGRISAYHSQQDEIAQVILQTLFAIDNGGAG